MKVTVAVGVVETDLVGVEENVALGGIVVVLIVGMGFVREGVGVDVRIKVLVLVGELVNVAVL